MSKRLSRDAMLVKYFAQQYPGIPRKYLAKYLYEADVLAREYLGHPLSTLTYMRDDYGPYDRSIPDVTRELVEKGYAQERFEVWDDEQGRTIRLYDLHEPVTFDFDIGEVAVLEYVVKNYIRMPFPEFLRDVIYETAPMKADVPMHSPLPMDDLNHAGTRKVGFDLGEVLRAEESARRGEVVTLSELMNELRARTPA